MPVEDRRRTELRGAAATSMDQEVADTLMRIRPVFVAGVAPWSRTLDTTPAQLLRSGAAPQWLVGSGRDGIAPRRGDSAR